jgi:hypothetical protein
MYDKCALSYGAADGAPFIFSSKLQSTHTTHKKEKNIIKFLYKKKTIILVSVIKFMYVII